MFMGVKMDIQKIGFGDFCTIEQKRYVGPNEFYSYKVVGRKKSNVWTDVPVDANNEKETLHDHLDDVVTVVCNNLDDRTVHQFRVSDLASVRKSQAVPEYAEFYLGGGVFAICDWKDYEKVKNFKWNTSSRQYRTQWVWANDPKNADINRRKVAMHNLIMCPPEGLYVDHINGNGLDNRRSNLRIVTKQQNTFNSAHKGGTSKYKGVCLEKESGMWKAYITKDGKKKSIGRFALEDDAARAYDKEAISLFREHAKLNFLPKAMIEAQEQKVTEMKINWGMECPRCNHNEAIIHSTAEKDSGYEFMNGDAVNCLKCGNTGEMDANSEDSDIVWNEYEAQEQSHD